MSFLFLCILILFKIGVRNVSFFFLSLAAYLKYIDMELFSDGKKDTE